MDLGKADNVDKVTMERQAFLMRGEDFVSAKAEVARLLKERDALAAALVDKVHAVVTWVEYVERLERGEVTV